MIYMIYVQLKANITLSHSLFSAVLIGVYQVHSVMIPGSKLETSTQGN